MSELIDNASRRKELLAHMILELHAGRAPVAVRMQLIRLLGEIPYNDVVEVEQQLIEDGLPVEEVLRLCDVHTAAMEGMISGEGTREVPAGHPVDTFRRENRALAYEVRTLDALFTEAGSLPDCADTNDLILAIRERFNHLMDVEKHYLRKEHLLFPFLEAHGITGPPKVMWGKHDETRGLLKSALGSLGATEGGIAPADLRNLVARVLRPCTEAIVGMIDKEEQILLPMCLDTLEEREWIEIAEGTPEIGFCLVEPEDAWPPPGERAETATADSGDPTRVPFATGSLTRLELETILNTIPFDLTYVDAHDTVRYFTRGSERIFARSRAIIGRKVQHCHPPSSVHVVEQILDAFRSGEQDRAAFWIDMKGRFLSIEYFAVRDGGGAYLGCLEVSQDLTEKRALNGERRLLTWDPTSPAPGRPGSASGAQAADAGAREQPAAAIEPPAWLVDPAAIFDARPVIASGEHPLPQVMQHLADLRDGDVFELVTPFVPTPLIDVARGKGYLAWTAPASETGVVRSYFKRDAPGSPLP